MYLRVPPTKKSLSCEDLGRTSYFNSVPLPGEEQTGNDKETSIKIQFCCSDDTSADEDFGTITEDEIESNFHSYRPYIESCIKMTDLIVYFKPFTSEQVKKFYKTSKTDHQGALRLAFDTILDMDTISDKFQQLLQALEDAGYPKVVGLLKGLLIPIHEANREKVKTHAKDIYERLSVSDILPYLLTYRVLNHHDVDEIKSAEKNESRGSAVIQLLSTLPNRSKEWFENFISALVGSQQRDLAMIIDTELTQVLEAAAVFGVNTPISKSSLVVSVKGLRKKYGSKSFSEIDFKREDVTPSSSSGYTKRSTSMEYGQSGKNKQKGKTNFTEILIQKDG